MAAQLPIVVCGESLLDVFDNGATPAGLALDAVVGGSPLNVAMGLVRMGQPAVFFGGVSRDFLGERILRSIRQEGIAEDALVLCDAPTTLSLVGVDAQGVPSYRFYGHAAADRQLLPEHLERLPAQVAAIHLGSYACVVPPVDATLRQLVEQRRADSVIAYDPNVRLNVEPDLGVWRQQVDWMAHRCHLLKLSDEDFERLYPGLDPQAKAEEWLSLGVCLVMLTRGGSGATAWKGGRRFDVPAPQVQVQDTVGAGDTFQAACLMALAELGCLTPKALADIGPEQVRQVLQFGVTAAAITCTRRGPDLPRRAELPVLG